MDKKLHQVALEFKRIEKETLTNDIIQNQYWYNIRFPIYYKICESMNLFERAHRISIPRQEKCYIKNLLRKVRIVYKKNPLIFKKRKPYIFFGHQRRKKMNDGYYWDIYTDPITLGPLRNQTITIEDRYYGRHYSPTITNNLYYMESLKLMGLLLNRFSPIPDMGEEVFKLLNDFEDKIENVFQIRLPVKKIGEQYYYKIERQRKLMKYLFKCLKPEIIFLVCSYGKEGIILSAKDLGIPIVELQHGVISVYHLGYDMLPQFPKLSSPDFFFVFSDYWKDVANYSISINKIITIGYPFFEEKISKYSTNKKRNSIVFISQGTIGKELSKFAVELYTNSPRMEIIYKLHPGEVQVWREEYPWLYKKSVENKIRVVDSSIPDLYEILINSLVQVGVYSTAIFEGYKLGCQTFLVDLPGIEYMDDFISKGYGIKVKTPIEIVKKIKKYTEKNTDDVFFSNNWKDRFVEALNIVKDSL